MFEVAFNKLSVSDLGVLARRNDQLVFLEKTKRLAFGEGVFCEEISNTANGLLLHLLVWLFGPLEELH
jgi:hypothetical protein